MSDSSPANGVIDLEEHLTAEWVTEALRSEGHDVTVTRVEREPVGTGQMGASYRLRLTHDHPDLPATMVAKLPSPDVGGRSLVAGAYHSEVSFYRDLAPTVAAHTPAIHHSAISEDHTRFVLLMEDLAPRQQGDQIAGCTVDEARAAVVNLAGLHGPRWCDQTLLDHEWLTIVDESGAEMLAVTLQSATELFIERYAGRVTDGEATVLRGAAKAIDRWVLAEPERFGLLHGDYRLDNLLFPPGGDGPVVAVDWQTLSLGLPGRDLAYFLGTSLDPTDRAAAERELVAAYHEELVGFGVEDYDVEACFEDYRLGMLQAPLITVFGAAYGNPTERGDEMFMAMTSRSCAAIRELDTLGAVP